MPLGLRRRLLLGRLLLRRRIGATTLGVPDLERAAGTATGAGEIARNAASIEQHGSKTGWFESIGMSAGEIFVPAACLFPPQASITAIERLHMLQLPARNRSSRPHSNPVSSPASAPLPEPPPHVTVVPTPPTSPSIPQFRESRGPKPPRAPTGGPSR